MKNFLYLIILMIASNLAFGASVWPDGEYLKTLGSINGVKFGNGVTTLTGTLDPTVTAVDAVAGSLYQSTNGKTYVKQDAGSTVNWSVLADETTVSAINHNDTQTIQGGTSTERYHLDAEEHGNLDGVNTPSTAELKIGDDTENKKGLIKKSNNAIGADSLSLMSRENAADGAWLNLKGKDSSSNPNTAAFYSPTGKTLEIKADGTVSASTVNYDTLVTTDDVLANKKYVDDSITTATASMVDTDETTILDDFLVAWDNVAKKVKKASNSILDGFLRATGFFGDYTDPFHFAVQDGLDYNATDSSMQGSAEVAVTEVSEKLKIATLTGDASTAGSLMAFDAVTDPEIWKDAWHTVFFNYGISGSVSEQFQCAVYDNNVKIAGQYEPKLSGNGNQNAPAKIQFQMPTSPTKIQLKCEQLVVGTNTLTVSKIIWSKKPEDQISLPKGSETLVTRSVASAGFDGVLGDYRLKFDASSPVQDSLDKVVEIDNSGNYTIVRAKTRADVDFQVQFYSATTGTSYVNWFEKNEDGVKLSMRDSFGQVDANANRIRVELAAGDELVFHTYDFNDAQNRSFSITATPIGADTGIVAEGETPLSAFEWPTYTKNDLTITGLSSVTRALLQYKEIGGRHFISGYIVGTSASTTSLAIGITGINYEATTNNYQAVLVHNGTAAASGRVTYNTNSLTAASNTATTTWRINFNLVELTAKPSFVSDEDTKLGGPISVMAKSAVDNNVSVQGRGNSGSTLTANVTDIDFTEVVDNTGAWNGTTYTVQNDDSVVDISGEVIFSSTGNRALRIYKNGTYYAVASSAASSPVVDFSYRSYKGEFSKGDTITVRSDSTGTLFNSTTGHYINIREHWLETGFISTSKSAIPDHVERVSTNERQCGKDEITGKTVYCRWIHFPSNVTASNTTYLNVGTGLTPVDSFEYSAGLWHIRSYTAAGTSTAAALIYYNKSSGYVATSLATYKIGAGTRILFKYIKD